MNVRGNEMKVKRPNYTQAPNEIFDSWLPELGEVELKVLLVVMRKTFGWHRVADQISISQLEKHTGSSATNIMTAVKSLLAKGFLKRKVEGLNGKQTTTYELIIYEDSDEPRQSQGEIKKSYTPDKLSPLINCPPPQSQGEIKKSYTPDNLSPLINYHPSQIITPDKLSVTKESEAFFSEPPLEEKKKQQQKSVLAKESFGGSVAVFSDLPNQELGRFQSHEPASCAAHTVCERKTPQPAKPIPVNPSVKAEPAKPKVYANLVNVDIPDHDKKEITSRYSEECVKNAIEYATSPQTKITKGLCQAIKWACQNKPEVPKNPLDKFKANKAYAMRYDNARMNNGQISVCACNQHVEIIYHGCQKQPETVRYEENGFKDQFDNALRKNGFIILK